MAPAAYELWDIANMLDFGGCWSPLSRVSLSAEGNYTRILCDVSCALGYVVLQNILFMRIVFEASM